MKGENPVAPAPVSPFAANQVEITAPILNNVEPTETLTEPFTRIEEVRHQLEEEVVSSVKQEELKFEDTVTTEWEIVTPTAVVEEKPEVIRHSLDEEVSVNRVVEPSTRTVLSNEEQQRRAADRLARIQEYTAKLKKADGISEFEKEPAYVRQNIQLDHSKFSSENRTSRFGVSSDENGTTLRGNNSFLHDNVD